MNSRTSTRLIIGTIILVLVAIWIWQNLGETDSHSVEGSIRVVDGDTVEIDGVYYRAVNYDTPETAHRAECDSERERGERATERLRQFAGDGLEIIPIGRQDRYERELANFLTSDGQNIADVFAAEGIAVYWGDGPEDWCTERWR